MRIQETIRIGGLANVKAKRIQEILSQIDAEYGGLSLQALRKMNVKEALEALLKYNGVGLKTANCVALFALKMNAFPVDTHILRISKRIGLIPDGASLDRAHDLWTRFLPEELAYPLHLNLITHGRRVCRPRDPRCLDCCLGPVCRSYARLLKKNSAGA
jgi:endonuclease-3